MAKPDGGAVGVRRSGGKEHYLADCSEIAESLGNAKALK